MKSLTLVLALGVCALATPGLAATPSPYAGEQSRSIKALSDGDIAALTNGDGMGMAKAAELNGYPGPVHVLALAKELGLSASQLRQVTAIHERMGAAARPLGTEIIDRERTLDQLFANGEITPDRLRAETTAIGDLEGRLRSVHLGAHLETRALLSPDQIARYQTLRGYGDGAAPMHHHQG